MVNRRRGLYKLRKSLVFKMHGSAHLIVVLVEGIGFGRNVISTAVNATTHVDCVHLLIFTSIVPVDVMDKSRKSRDLERTAKL